MLNSSSSPITQRAVRIAIVSEVFLPAVDGVVTRLTRTLEQFGAAGDAALMVAPAGGPSAYAGIPVVGVPELRMPLYPDGDGYPPKRVSLPGFQLRRALNEFKPDVIHAINPVLLAAGAVAYARQRRIPLVASYHAHLPTYAHLYKIGWLEGAGWRYIRMLHNSAQVNLATSRATLQCLAEHGIERLDLWPYGIETEHFHPRMRSEQWRARLSGGEPDKPLLLYVGRLAKEKKIERLLCAVADRDDVRLAIVGDGPLRDELKQAFAGTPTTFHGFLSGEDLAHAYASADVFLLPSDTETLGFVTLEAHAAGLPVIAADSPAAHELIEQGVDGYRYDPSRRGELRRVVDRLLADPARLAEMRLAARRAVGDVTWRNATDTLKGFYRLACERAGGAPVGPDPTLPLAA
jgi:glycosyltransferase involved in cell wall biosynthesis